MQDHRPLHADSQTMLQREFHATCPNTAGSGLHHFLEDTLYDIPITCCLVLNQLQAPQHAPQHRLQLALRPALCPRPPHSARHI